MLLDEHMRLDHVKFGNVKIAWNEISEYQKLSRRQKTIYAKIYKQFWPILPKTDDKIGGKEYKGWPAFIRTIFFKEHKDYRERYRLFLFFVKNGMSPQEAVDWIRMKRVKKYTADYDDYDNAAIQHMKSMVRDVNNGKFWQQKHSRMMDLELGYPTPQEEVDFNNDNHYLNYNKETN